MYTRIQGVSPKAPTITVYLYENGHMLVSLGNTEPVLRGAMPEEEVIRTIENSNNDYVITVEKFNNHEEEERKE